MVTNTATRKASSFASSHLPLLGIMVLAVVLRLAYLVFFTAAINPEGAEYARIAQNLVQGKGYVGLALEGRELMFPPLYPLTIATAAVVTRDFYLAAQLVSFTAGLALLVAVFGIASDLYGRRTAYLATLAAALHPVLIYLSATTWVEGLYIALVTGSIYLVNRCQDDGRGRYWVLAGSTLGLAYLTCPQAVLFPFSFLVLLVVLGRSTITPFKVAAFAGSFVILALPYAVFLSLSTGAFRIEGKTIVNNELGRRVLAGVPQGIASFEVTPALDERGVWMRPNADVARTSTALGYGTTLRIMVTRGVSNLKQVFLDISTSPAFGAPFILPLVVLGLFGSAWTHQRLRGELILLTAVLCATIPMTTIIHQFASRYYYILIPFLIIWASCGITELGAWASRTILNAGAPAISARSSAALFGGLVYFGVVAAFVAGSVRMAAADQNGVAIRQLGEWLSRIPGEKTVMDTGAVVAFHGSARYVPMPWCDSETALRYAEKKGVDFIVVNSWEADRRPYLHEWLESRTPGANVSLVHTVETAEHGRIVVFRLDRTVAAERNRMKATF